MAEQIKSKQRVAEHGEVFTAEREVNAMLDLVRQETERIDSRFLEPACGTGNFLVEILRRKLLLVRSDCEMVQAVCSIYGIDILQDNVEECRERLLGVIEKNYRKLEGDLLATVQYVLRRNILWGDALTLCTPEVSTPSLGPLPPPSPLGREPLRCREGAPSGEGAPIVFSEWGFIGQAVKRRDFTLDMLLRPRSFDGPSLFDELGDEVFVPEPCAEYPMLNYDKLYTQDAADQ